MIHTVDQRIFYLEDYNPLSTLTLDFPPGINVKTWISNMLNISIQEIISQKTLMNVLRDYQNILPKHILAKIGKNISNPGTFFYSYLKTLMLFNNNPVSIFNETPYPVFEEKDLLNKAVQKFIDPVTYLHAIEIISLFTLTETRIQIMKKHKESDTRFVEIFEKLINYEIVFNSSQEFSVIDLKGLTSEIEYIALSFINNKERRGKNLNTIPSLILKVSDGIILINTPRTIRYVQELLEEKVSFHQGQIIRKPADLPVTEEITVPPVLTEEKTEVSDEKSVPNDEIADEGPYEKLKKIGLSEQKSKFMVSGNLQLGMSMPEEEFLTNPGP